MAKYTIKKGDSLAALAKKWGVTTSQVLDANPGVYGLGPGVTLRIPQARVTPDPFGRKPKQPTPPLPTPISIPPRFTPEPGTPYRPPPPKPGVTPKAPELPPVYQPAPPPQPTYIDPGLRPYITEPTYTSPYAPTQPPTITVQPGTPQAKVVGYLNRLFNRRPGVVKPQVPPLEPSRPGARPNYWQQFFRAPSAGALGRAFEQTGQDVNRFFGHYGPPAPSAERRPGLEPSRVGGVPSPTTFAQLVEQGMTPTQAALAIESAGGFAPPTVGTMGIGGFPEFEGEAYPGYPAQRSSILEWYLDQGRLPVIFFREDLARLGITEQELLAAGYVKDQYGDWVRGTQEPGEVERAATGGGTARRGRGGGGRGGRGGGYGYPGYGGGGGFEINFPEGGRSFVERTQKGQSPTGRSMRPARMGAVTWRI